MLCADRISFLTCNPRVPGNRTHIDATHRDTNPHPPLFSPCPTSNKSMQICSTLYVSLHRLPATEREEWIPELIEHGVSTLNWEPGSRKMTANAFMERLLSAAYEPRMLLASDAQQRQAMP